MLAPHTKGKRVFSRSTPGSWPPKKIEHAMDKSSVVRVNLLIEVKGCCSNAGTGLIDEPPPELFQSGLQRYNFDQWIERLEGIRKLRSTDCFDLTICCCVFPLCSCLIPCIIKSSRALIEKWDQVLRQWQNDLNQQALAPCGIFAKTQSPCIVGNENNS